MERSMTLAEALPKEQARVRELVLQYRNPILKGAGELAACFMEESLRLAEKAVMEQDTVAMLRAYEDLSTWGDD